MKYLLTGALCAFLAACSAESGPLPAPESTFDVQAALPVLSGNHVWDLDEAASKLTFKAVHNGREFEGVFSNFSAAINLDPSAPETGEIHAVIAVAAFDAGDGDRNANLPGSEWFDVKNYPAATFISNNIRVLDGNNYEARGDLTIKGTAQPVNLKFSLTVDGDIAAANGGVTFSRRLFDVGSGPDFENEDWVKFPVDVMFEIKASR